MKAIVTGASKGLGRVISEFLIREGYDVMACARSIKPSDSPKLHAYPCDLLDAESIRQSIDRIKVEHGTPDIIVNNFGLFDMDNPEQLDISMLERMLNANLWAAIRVTDPFVEAMAERKSGHIFNICSIVNKMPKKEACSYTISKFALQGWNDTLREQLRDKNVKVTAIFPGSINTSSWDGIEAPKDTFVQPEDIASIVIDNLKSSIHSLQEEIVIRPLDTNY